MVWLGQEEINEALNTNIFHQKRLRGILQNVLETFEAIQRMPPTTLQRSPVVSGKDLVGRSQR